MSIAGQTGVKQVGPNEIRRESGPPWWRSLLDQFIHPLLIRAWVWLGLLEAALVAGGFSRSERGLRCITPT